jgi:molybdopterin molybdotransferase
MLSVEEALAFVAKNALPLGPRRVPLGEAAGLVLAEEVVSEVDSPPYSKSMMDGYAVRSVDRGDTRTILAEVAAGDVPRHPLTPGTAVRIMTGAPIPDGADAVVPIEYTELVDETTVKLHRVDPSRGQHILPVGSSLRVGDVVLHEGAIIRPIEIGILAEIGRAMISVRPRPRVAILPTGNELVPVGEKPAQGQIRNSNGPMLVAAAERAGAAAMELGIARDNRDLLRQWMEQGLAADVLVLSGGVSAGAFDLVPDVLAELGVERVFHKIALRPGKPLWFGVKHDTDRRVLVFGLPGNPVSSFVCFELFVRPAIAALAGRGFRQAAMVTATLSRGFEHKEQNRESWLPARLSPAEAILTRAHEGGQVTNPPTLEILPWHGSADLAILASANALVRVPKETQRLATGETVHAINL